MRRPGRALPWSPIRTSWETTAPQFTWLWRPIRTFVVIVALQVLYFRFDNEQQQRLQNGTVKTSSDAILAEQRSRMGQYEWIDETKNQVRIPVERAMELVVRERTQPSAPAPESEGSDEDR